MLRVQMKWGKWQWKCYENIFWVPSQDTVHPDQHNQRQLNVKNHREMIWSRVLMQQVETSQRKRISKVTEQWLQPYTWFFFTRILPVMGAHSLQPHSVCRTKSQEGDTLPLCSLNHMGRHCSQRQEAGVLSGPGACGGLPGTHRSVLLTRVGAQVLITSYYANCWVQAPLPWAGPSGTPNIQRQRSLKKL